MPEKLLPPCAETMRMAALMVRSTTYRLSPAAYCEGAARLAAEQALAAIIGSLDDIASLLDSLPAPYPGTPARAG